MTDPEQLQRFREALEEKRRRAQAASHGRPPLNPPPEEIHGDEPDLWSPARPQDEVSPRAKSTRHKKVTADHWNQ